MGLSKITEKAIAQILSENAYVLVTQQEQDESGTAVESLRRVPLSVFFSEIYDARNGNPAEDGSTTTYNSVGEFLRTIASKLDSADLDVDLSNLDFMEDDGVLYLYDKKKEQIIGDGWVIQGGGGSSGGTGAVMKLVNTMGTTAVPVALGQPCTITFRFSSLDDEDKTPTGNGSASYLLNGEQIATASIPQGDQSYTIPASSLKEGVNTFGLTVTDAYGTTKSISWTITVKSISLTCTLDDTVINTGDLLIRYTPIGSDIAKTTTFELDGVVVATAETNDTNLAKSYTLVKQAHGAHTLRMWCSATIGGVTVQSPVITYHPIWVAEGNETPIISIKSYGDVKQYSTVSIPYMIYHPLTLQAAVTLAEDDVVVSSLTVDRSLQTWLYKPTTTGDHVLTITCGTTTATATVHVESSGVTVAEITDGLLWCFDPAGRSNSEADRAVWSDGDVSMAVSDGFHWSHGGWGADVAGIDMYGGAGVNRHRCEFLHGAGLRFVRRS